MSKKKNGETPEVLEEQTTPIEVGEEAVDEDQPVKKDKSTLISDLVELGRSKGKLTAQEIINKHLGKEQETWNGIHGQITAPNGTFERIFNNADEEDDDI